jgi:hypothetical protein
MYVSGPGGERPMADRSAQPVYIRNEGNLRLFRGEKTEVRNQKSEIECGQAVSE